MVDKRPEWYLSTLDAVEAISCTGTDTPGLLQLVRQGIFNPKLFREEKGLSRLLFRKDELKKYRNAYFDKKSSKFAVYRVRNILGVDERTVRRLINAGLIKASIEIVGGKQRTYILRKDFDEFKSEYLFLKDAAALLGAGVKTVLRLVKHGRLKDYSGIPITSRAKYRIFRKQEIELFVKETDMNKWKQATLIPYQEL